MKNFIVRGNRMFALSALFFLSLLILSPQFIFAQSSGCDTGNGGGTGITYNTLAPIGNFVCPTINVNPDSLVSYLNNLVRFGIGLAGGFAVVMITFGGIQYMSTDSLTGTEHGRETIRNALLGLLLALMAYLILYTINPQIVNSKLNITPIQNSAIPQNANVAGSNSSISAVTGASGGGLVAMPVLIDPATGLAQIDSQNNPAIDLAALSPTQLDYLQSTYSLDSSGNPVVDPATGQYEDTTGYDVGTTIHLPSYNDTFLNNTNINGIYSYTPTGSAIDPTATAYSPQAGGSAMEGGYASAYVGLDGQRDVKTLDDYTSGASTYITLAGDPSQKGQTYIIPTITYTNSAGQNVTLTNVTGYVNDTGGAFSGAGTSHFDIAVGKNYTNSQLNSQPFSGQGVTFVPVATPSAQK